MRPYSHLKTLRSDGEIIFEGVKLRYIGEWDTLQPGDTYLAERNTVQLLTVLKVNVEKNWVSPVENAYPFDLGECVKVEILLEED